MIITEISKGKQEKLAYFLNPPTLASCNRHVTPEVGKFLPNTTAYEQFSKRESHRLDDVMTTTGLASVMPQSPPDQPEEHWQVAEEARNVCRDGTLQ